MARKLKQNSTLSYIDEHDVITDPSDLFDIKDKANLSGGNTINLAQKQSEEFIRKKFRVVQSFPYLYNIKPFIIKHHPTYHPETRDYELYWEDQEKKCIEGFWGLDHNGVSGGYRYIPGTLFYYVNYCVIEDQDDLNNSIGVIAPLLRDIEWGFFYNWAITRGFSGFEDDDEYTCNLLIRKLELGINLTPIDKKRLESVRNILKPDGSYKKYIHPREYLYKTHDKPLGRPLYNNTAKNMFCLTSRRTGKSFWLAGLISHTYKFHGALYYDDAYFDMKKGPEIVVGSAVSTKSSDLLNKFKFMEEYQTSNFGNFGENEDFIPGYFHSQSLGTLVVSNSKSPYRNEYDYVENGVWKKGGKKTKIIHVTWESSSEAAVGTGPSIIIVEEVGLAEKILNIHAANEAAMIRTTKFGSALYAGTAGNLDKIHGCKLIFEDPASYDMLEFEDVWEDRVKPIGFFIPAYYRNNKFRDENGNQDIYEAFEEEMIQRALKSDATSSLALDMYIMSNPLTPSEMFMSKTANLFPVAMIRDTRINIEIKDLFKLYSSVGDLSWTDGYKTAVKWKEDITRKNTLPLTELKLDKYNGKIGGCIVIYEHPEDDIPAPTSKKSLYKIAYDPYLDDGGGTSLASILVYKGSSENSWAEGMSDNIVAEYIGRMDLVESIHDIALKLATYYNAKVMVETNIPDFIRYCKREGKVNTLQVKPYDAISRAVKNPGKKYDVGIDMTASELHRQAEQLIRQWLLTEWKNKDGVKYYNCHKLRSPMLLAQLESYDPKGNFDHISSLKLLILWLAQERHVPIKKDSDEIKEDINTFFKNLTGKSNPYSVKINSNYHNF